MKLRKDLTTEHVKVYEIERLPKKAKFHCTSRGKSIYWGGKYVYEVIGNSDGSDTIIRY